MCHILATAGVASKGDNSHPKIIDIDCNVAERKWITLHSTIFSKGAYFREKKNSPRRRVDFTCLNLQVGNSWHIFVKQQSSDKLILHLIYRKKCSQVSALKLRLHLFANLEQQDLIVILIFLPKRFIFQLGCGLF